jgi:hypothetical protein
MRVFLKDADFEAFERTIEKTLESLPMRICAYCLLSNHWLSSAWQVDQRLPQIRTCPSKKVRRTKFGIIWKESKTRPSRPDVGKPFDQLFPSQTTRWRRHHSKLLMASGTSMAMIDGSGTGAKARKLGIFNPLAKIVWFPSGEIS